MTTTRTWPDHLLSLAEWDALPEDATRRIELVEGVLLVTPRPTPLHQRVAARLATALEAGLGPGWGALVEIELVVDATEPPTVRCPDVTVVRAECVDRRPRVGATNVLAVAEILSTGTRRTDRITKLAEYADAGIAHYLLVEPGPPVTLVEFQLVAGRYERVAGHRGRTTVTLDTDVALDLDALGG